MGKNTDSSVENIVRLSSRCEKSYKKLEKKGDKKLLKTITENIDELKINENVGHELIRDLKGYNSIRLERFKYRIIYKIQKSISDTIVTIHVISHRNNAYSDFSAYLETTQELN